MKLSEQESRFDWKTAAVLLLAAMSLLAWLGSRGLNEPDEGRYSEIAREMSLQSNWLIPHLNGVEHFQKPPLTYWLTATSIRILGANEWAVRLIPAGAAWGTIACVMFMAGRLFGSSVRWKAGLILLTSFEFFALARIITTDMLLTFWITAAIAGLVAYHTKPASKMGLIVFYLSMGLGFLTKGPMAFLVPGCAAWGLRYGLRKSGKSLPAMSKTVGILVALTIGLSWFLLVIAEYPPMWKYFLGYELFERIATNVHDRSKPFGYYAAVLLGGFLPWSFFLPALLHAAWEKRRTLDRTILGLFGGWLVLPLIALSIANSKLPTYILPFFPALSLAMAYGWDRIAGRRTWLIAKNVVAWFFVILLAASPFIIVMARELYMKPIPLPPDVAVCAIVCGILFFGFRLIPNSERGRCWALPWLSVSTLTLVILLASQVDRLLLGSNSTVRNMAALILREEGDTPARVFMCGVRSNGMEFYLRRFVERTETASDEVLKPDPATLARIVKDDQANRHIKELSKQHAYIVTKESRFREDPIFSNWNVRTSFGTCVLLTPRAETP